MVDPLTEAVSLLQPSAALSKVVTGDGAWRVRRTETGRPFYCVVLRGSCRLAADGHEPITLEAGDFVLIPAAGGFTMSGLAEATPDGVDPSGVSVVDGQTRHGVQEGPPEVRLLVGYCNFASPDAALLVSLLPKLVHVRGERRLGTLVQWVVDESRQARPARDAVLTRLLELLFIEALRYQTASTTSPGLVRGLSDARVALALRKLHECPTHAWTVAELAKEAALSRTTFFERFSRVMGVAPMAYLLAWRMAMAKNLLVRNQGGLAEVAERVGYRSASTFSVAFARHVGVSPGRYVRQRASRHEDARPATSPGDTQANVG